MTEFIGANPTLMAIALVGILFVLVDAIKTRERRRLRLVTRRHQRRGEEGNLGARLPVYDRWR